MQIGSVACKTLFRKVLDASPAGAPGGRGRGLSRTRLVPVAAKGQRDACVHGCLPAPRARARGQRATVAPGVPAQRQVRPCGGPVRRKRERLGGHAHRTSRTGLVTQRYLSMKSAAGPETRRARISPSPLPSHVKGEGERTPLGRGLGLVGLSQFGGLLLGSPSAWRNRWRKRPCGFRYSSTGFQPSLGGLWGVVSPSMISYRG